MSRPLQTLIGALGAFIVLVLAIGILNLRTSAPQPQILMAAPGANTTATPPLTSKQPSLRATAAAMRSAVPSAPTLDAPTPAIPAAQPIVTATTAHSSTVHLSKLVAPRLYTYRVVNVLPHDPTAFTQGLVFEAGDFYEGTGQRGASTLRRVDPATGNVEQAHTLEAPYFGEGIAIYGDKIYQLTWQEQTGFIYDKSTFAPLGSFSYTTEGWGITSDDTRLIVSDGTSILYFWDPETLQATGGVYVSLLGLPVNNLNELEMVDSEIFANVWKTDLVLRIDPVSGQVTGVVDLSGLLAYGPPVTGPVDVLNGIAYDSNTGRLWVTGKYWPAIFEIELVEVNQ